jgi:hypothetical protein
MQSLGMIVLYHYHANARLCGGSDRCNATMWSCNPCLDCPACSCSPIMAKNSAPHSGAVAWVRGLVERIDEPMQKLRTMNKVCGWGEGHGGGGREHACCCQAAGHTCPCSQS